MADPAPQPPLEPAAPRGPDGGRAARTVAAGLAGWIASLVLFVAALSVLPTQTSSMLLVAAPATAGLVVAALLGVVARRPGRALLLCAMLEIMTSVVAYLVITSINFHTLVTP